MLPDVALPGRGELVGQADAARQNGLHVLYNFILLSLGCINHLLIRLLRFGAARFSMIINEFQPFAVDFIKV